MQVDVPSFYYAAEQLVTPLAPIRLSEQGPHIWCKLEYHNPSGSTKDRIARFILGKAVRCGALRRGDYVVEASSGSTSIALALMCAQFRLKFIAVMPRGVSRERIAMIQAFGAEVVLTPADEGVAGAIAVAERISQDRQAFATRQFENLDNPAAHRHQTAVEIMGQIPARRVDAVVSGVGTGGTLVGLFQGFKDFGCEVIPVVAIPRAHSSAFELECSSFSNKIPGVVDCLSAIYGNADLPGLMQVDVDEEDAIATTRALIRAGYPVGPSSGLNYVAAAQIAGTLPEGASVVTVFPDRMERYLSTAVFSS
jgi:cysteine synthase A